MELYKEINIFTKELFHYGVRILICGGGVSFHPGEALSVLSMKYKKDKLLQLSKQVAFETFLKCPEGTVEVARGIIYHLADKELLDELIALRQQRLKEMPPANYKEDTQGIEELIDEICSRLEIPYPEGVETSDPLVKCRDEIQGMEELIAGICNRLKIPCPEGIEPLDSQMEAYLFWG